MRIFFVVPDGIGIRNYLFSPIISYLSGHQVGLIHDLPDELVQTVANHHGVPLEKYRLPKYKPTGFISLLGKLSTFSRLLRNSRIEKNPDIETRFVARKKAGAKLGFSHAWIISISRLISYSPKLIDYIDDYHAQLTCKLPEAKTFDEVLHAAKPDIVICTHQRSQFAGLMMERARLQNIPTVGVIFSWDNLPKSKIWFKPDHYFVWSDYMQNELLKYYPAVKPSQVFITGTPQFECYQNKSLLWSKQEFCEKLNIPFRKQIICFSGGDLNMPNDQYYADDLAKAMEYLPENEKPFLLIRPAPVDVSGRFQFLADKYKSAAAVRSPLWTKGLDTKFSAIYPTLDDVQLLTNICHHCDLVINIGSTMGLDFAFFNKPAVYITYEQPFNGWHSNKQIYNQQHFRTLKDLDGVVWVHEKEQLLPMVLKALEKPNELATERLLWKKRLTNDINNASQNIAEQLLQLAKPATTSKTTLQPCVE